VFSKKKIGSPWRATEFKSLGMLGGKILRNYLKMQPGSLIWVSFWFVETRSFGEANFQENGVFFAFW